MTAAPPPPSDEERAASLDAAIRMLGLVVAPEWRAEVLAHMKVTAEAARLVLDFPLDDTVDPAPVFSP
jgi:hypothetical protein